MKGNPLSGFLQSLRNSASLAGHADLEDGRLLERFLRERDEKAFEVILRRHGPMVLGVCRRVLGDEDDAEDAFQATFLVLLRKGRSLRSKGLLAKWLFGVATRTALKARTQAARRRLREIKAAANEHHRVDGQSESLSLASWIDEEVARLPDKYRLPVILCHIQGMTLEQVSHKLGWPIGTVSGRLSRARAVLRERMGRQAVSAPLGLPEVVELLGPKAVPTALVQTTTETVFSIASGRVAESGVPVAIILLSKGVIHEMFWNQARMVVVLLVAAGLVGGMAALGQSRLTEQPTEVKKEEAAPPPQESFKEYIARVRGWRAQDSDSDTDEASFPRFDDRWYLSALASARLPPKVMATMQARHDAAAVELDGRWKEFLAGRGMLDLLFGACERMLRSEAEVDKKREHQVRVLEGHLKRMQEILKVNKDRYEAGRIPVQDVAESEFYYQDAKLRLEQARENP